ncbi:ATP-grasp domain-containing protein, partial [Streptomyces sp. SID10244]|nr:ATP-grasp domain-containing protein [Streptomyces sp. SID10244]
PGRKKMITAAVLRDVLKHPRNLHTDLVAARGATGVYDQKGDRLPLLYSALSLQHVLHYRKELGIDRNTREQLMATQFFDVSWDGSAIG